MARWNAVQIWLLGPQDSEGHRQVKGQGLVVGGRKQWRKLFGLMRSRLDPGEQLIMWGARACPKSHDVLGVMPHFQVLVSR